MRALPTISVVAVGDREIRIVVLPVAEPRGAVAMLGFAKRFRATRTTRDWMRELREGVTARGSLDTRHDGRESANVQPRQMKSLGASSRP